MTQTCIARNCSMWPKLAQKKLSKFFQNGSKLFKKAENCSKLLKTAQSCSKCFKYLKSGQQVSKGVMCLHIQVRKLSLLGIAVNGIYHCMGLMSVSIAPRSCLLLRSKPSIVNFNRQGSLVIRLAAIVSINGLSRIIILALIEKNRSCPQFLLFHYCLLVIPQSNINFWHFFVFGDLKGTGSKPEGSTPQIANSDMCMCMCKYMCMRMCMCIYVYVYM